MRSSSVGVALVTLVALLMPMTVAQATPLAAVRAAATYPMDWLT